MEEAQVCEWKMKDTRSFSRFTFVRRRSLGGRCSLSVREYVEPLSASG